MSAGMEALGFALSVVFLYALYHVVRLGVRDGIREARRDTETRD